MQLDRKIKIIGLLICFLTSGFGALKTPPTVIMTVPAATATLISSSPTPGSTSTPTVEPTMTLVPALPAKEAEIKLTEMLSNNGNCRLPCFWGFTPGKTKIGTVLSSGQLYHALFNPTGGWAELDIIRGNLTLVTSIVIGENIHASSNDILRLLTVRFLVYRGQNDGTSFVYDNPSYAQYFQYYTLPYVLSTYGKPENVYIHYEYEGDVREYYVILDYTKSGWVASFTMQLYQGSNASEDVWEGCPSEAFTTLVLWSPGDTDMAQKYGYAYGPGRLISIEKANSLTLDEFYQLYKDPAYTKCLQTPKGIQP